MATALAGMARLVGHNPADLKVVNLVPDQGTCLGCGFCTGWDAYERQPIDVFLTSMFLSLFLPPFPSL